MNKLVKRMSQTMIQDINDHQRMDLLIQEKKKNLRQEFKIQLTLEQHENKSVPSSKYLTLLNELKDQSVKKEQQLFKKQEYFQNLYISEQPDQRLTSKDLFYLTRQSHSQNHSKNTGEYNQGLSSLGSTTDELLTERTSKSVKSKRDKKFNKKQKRKESSFQENNILFNPLKNHKAIQPNQRNLLENLEERDPNIPSFYNESTINYYTSQKFYKSITANYTSYKQETNTIELNDKLDSLKTQIENIKQKQEIEQNQNERLKNTLNLNSNDVQILKDQLRQIRERVDIYKSKTERNQNIIIQAKLNEQNDKQNLKKMTEQYKEIKLYQSYKHDKLNQNYNKQKKQLNEMEYDQLKLEVKIDDLSTKNEEQLQEIKDLEKLEQKQQERFKSLKYIYKCTQFFNQMNDIFINGNPEDYFQKLKQEAEQQKMQKIQINLQEVEQSQLENHQQKLIHIQKSPSNKQYQKQQSHSQDSFVKKLKSGKTHSFIRQNSQENINLHKQKSQKQKNSYSPQRKSQNYQQNNEITSNNQLNVDKQNFNQKLRIPLITDNSPSSNNDIDNNNFDNSNTNKQLKINLSKSPINASPQDEFFSDRRRRQTDKFQFNDYTPKIGNIKQRYTLQKNSRFGNFLFKNNSKNNLLQANSNNQQFENSQTKVIEEELDYQNLHNKVLDFIDQHELDFQDFIISIIKYYHKIATTQNSLQSVYQYTSNEIQEKTKLIQKLNDSIKQAKIQNQIIQDEEEQLHDALNNDQVALNSGLVMFSRNINLQYNEDEKTNNNSQQNNKESENQTTYIDQQTGEQFISLYENQNKISTLNMVYDHKNQTLDTKLCTELKNFNNYIKNNEGLVFQIYMNLYEHLFRLIASLTLLNMNSDKVPYPIINQCQILVERLQMRHINFYVPNYNPQELEKENQLSNNVQASLLGSFLDPYSKKMNFNIQNQKQDGSSMNTLDPENINNNNNQMSNSKRGSNSNLLNTKKQQSIVNSRRSTFLEGFTQQNQNQILQKRQSLKVNKSKKKSERYSKSPFKISNSDLDKQPQSNNNIESQTDIKLMPLLDVPQEEQNQDPLKKYIKNNQYFYSEHIHNFFQDWEEKIQPQFQSQRNKISNSPRQTGPHSQYAQQNLSTYNPSEDGGSTRRNKRIKDIVKEDSTPNSRSGSPTNNSQNQFQYYKPMSFQQQLHQQDQYLQLQKEITIRLQQLKNYEREYQNYKNQITKQIQLFIDLVTNDRITAFFLTPEIIQKYLIQCKIYVKKNPKYRKNTLKNLKSFAFQSRASLSPEITQQLQLDQQDSIIQSPSKINTMSVGKISPQKDLNMQNENDKSLLNIEQILHVAQQTVQQYESLKGQITEKVNYSIEKLFEGVQMMQNLIHSQCYQKENVEIIQNIKKEQQTSKKSCTLRSVVMKSKFIRDQYNNICVRHQKLKNWETLYPFSTQQQKIQEEIKNDNVEPYIKFINLASDLNKERKSKKYHTKLRKALNDVQEFKEEPKSLKKMLFKPKNEIQEGDEQKFVKEQRQIIQEKVQLQKQEYLQKLKREEELEQQILEQKYQQNNQNTTNQNISERKQLWENKGNSNQEAFQSLYKNAKLIDKIDELDSQHQPFYNPKMSEDFHLQQRKLFYQVNPITQSYLKGNTTYFNRKEHSLEQIQEQSKKNLALKISPYNLGYKNELKKIDTYFQDQKKYSNEYINQNQQLSQTSINNQVLKNQNALNDSNSNLPTQTTRYEKNLQDSSRLENLYGSSKKPKNKKFSLKKKNSHTFHESNNKYSENYLYQDKGQLKISESQKQLYTQPNQNDIQQLYQLNNTQSTTPQIKSNRIKTYESPVKSNKFLNLTQSTSSLNMTQPSQKQLDQKETLSFKISQKTQNQLKKRNINLQKNNLQYHNIKQKWQNQADQQYFLNSYQTPKMTDMLIDKYRQQAITQLNFSRSFNYQKEFQKNNLTSDLN